MEFKKGRIADSSDEDALDIEKVRIPKIKKFKPGNKIASRQKYVISKKAIRKAIKKKNMSEKSSKTAHKLIRKSMVNNPHWLYMKPVLQQKFGLKEATYWKKFREINIAEISHVPSQVIFDLLAIRNDQVKNFKIIKTDLKYIKKLYQQLAAYNKIDCSHVMQAVINMVAEGASFKQAYQGISRNFYIPHIMNVYTHF